MMVATVQWMNHCRRALSKSSLCFGGCIESMGGICLLECYYFKWAGNLLRISREVQRWTVCGGHDWFCRSTVIHCSMDVHHQTFGSLSFWRAICALNIYWMGCSWYLFVVHSNMPKHWTIWAAVLVDLDVVGTRAGHKWGADDYEVWEIPLPYFLEFFALFDHLTLLYRLSWIPVVCTIGFSVHHWRIRRRWLMCIGDRGNSTGLSRRTLTALYRFSSVQR